MGVISKYLTYIKMGLGIFVLAIFFYLYISKENIVQENKTLQETILKEKLRYSIIKEDLEMANTHIEQQEENYNTWKNQKVKIKYKVVYKYKEKTKGGSCEDKVKHLGNIDFNSL